MALSPIKPLNDSQEELERYKKACESLGCVEKYHAFLASKNTVEIKQEDYEVLEEKPKRRGRPKLNK